MTGTTNQLGGRDHPVKTPAAWRGKLMASCLFTTLVLAAAVKPGAVGAAEVNSVSVNFNVQGPRRGLEITVESLPAGYFEGAAAAAQTMDFQGIQPSLSQIAEMMKGSPEEIARRYPSVTLRLPLIAYETTPSFSNVNIETFEGETFDPLHYAQTGKKRYVGRVSITEFTQFVIAGRFSGHLYGEDETPGKVVDLGPVSGWFRSSLPVLDDPRFASDWDKDEKARMVASATLDGLRMIREGLGGESMGSGLFGVPPGVSPPAPGDLPSELLPGMPFVGDELCLCQCAYILTLPETDPCRQRCVSDGLQCEIESKDPETLTLRDQLAEFNLGPAAEEQMLQLLKSLPPDQQEQYLEMMRAGMQQMNQ